MGCTWVAVLGEEHLAATGAAHQLHLLAGRVAHDPAGEAGALVAEVDLALVEHHAALTGQHGLVTAGAEVDADQLLVLLGPALPGGRLLEGLQARPTHRQHPAGHPGERRTAEGAPGCPGCPGPGRTAAADRSREARWGPAAVARRRGRGLLTVAGRQRSRLAGSLLAVARRRTGLSRRLRVRRGARRRHAAARRRGQGRDDGRRGVHRGRGRRGGRRRGSRGRREALCGGLRRRGRARRRAERGRRGGLGGRREGRRGGGLRLLRGGLLLGDLTAEVLQQRVESAVEALPDGGEPPDVLQVEVAQHHGTFGGELRAVERVAGHLLAARDDTEVSGGDLRHLPGAVDASR